MRGPFWGMVLVGVAAGLAGCDEPASGPCDGVGCAGHGSCVAFGSTPSCLCDRGYRAQGLLCLAEEADGDSDVDADAEAVADTGSDGDTGDGGPDGGEPITMVVTAVEITTLRLCDLDGDGHEDNAVADLGSPTDELFATALSMVASRAPNQGESFVAHVPLVDDPARPDDPAATLIVFHGVDTDVPPDGSDDRSGVEPFYVGADSVDPCGEPGFFLPEASIDDGSLYASGGSLPFFYGTVALPLERAEIIGNVAPHGASADIYLCGCASVSVLGAVQAEDLVSDFTFLEVLLAGGQAFGIPSLPGLVPDVDLDGDGLETIELDESSHVARCIDGDLTVIEGRDCWADPRIVDAVSLTVRETLVGARFAGLAPGWEALVEGTCEGGPPEPSLWDPR